MGSTPVHHLPYPELTDPADVPADIKELADALDALIPSVPVIPPGGGGFVNIPVLEVGMSGQNRAGRQLAPVDFTNLGLAAPLGLWNLGSTADSSGNSRTLVNKGAVPFGPGINGLASTSAVFAGSTAQALYVDDGGTLDPFRITTGSWAAWFRTAKRGTAQTFISKWRDAGTLYSWLTQVGTANTTVTVINVAGTVRTLTGVSDVADDRWHHAVTTWDGTVLRLYVDGVLEAVDSAVSGALVPQAVPLNIGATAADGATAAVSSFYGRVDEAFVTADVLTDDQVRLLYCAKLAHALGAIPGDVRIAVHRLRKGAALATTDFPAAPARLHNFTAGALTDQGTNNQALTANPGTGAITAVAGADGAAGGGQSFTGAHQGLSSTDAGLPSGTAARTYGCWFKQAVAQNNPGLMSWGSGAGTAAHAIWLTAAGLIMSRSIADDITGPYAADGQWHFVVVVEDNAAGDGVRRKMYLDGRLVGGSTVLNPITLAGANRFRIGAWADGSGITFGGQVDGAFVYAGALTLEQVQVLYAKAAQDPAASTKNAGDHIERVDGNSLLATFDTLPTQYTVDLGVAA